MFFSTCFFVRHSPLFESQDRGRYTTVEPSNYTEKTLRASTSIFPTIAEILTLGFCFSV